MTTNYYSPDKSKQVFLDHVAQTSDFPLALEIERARGSRLYLKDGRSLIDFISGIAVSALGHGHPKVIQAIKDQADRHLHVMVYGEMIQRSQIDFAQLLISQLPNSLESIYLTNSGTEANEGALKLAKKFTGRSKMVSFEDSYHGDTQGSLSVTGRQVYREPFEPLLPHVHFCKFNGEDCFDVIDNETACVILEPIQGEGGVIPAQKEWLQRLVKHANDLGVLVIFDEIQTGFGRTGDLFAFQGFDVVPDILTIAKAAGGGLPLGGFIASRAILGSLKSDPPLSHVTTFGGHPLSCAAAYASLSAILEEDLLGRAKIIEEGIRSALKHDHILEIRGKGAMLGLQLSSPRITQQFVESCLESGLLLGWTLHSNTLVRIAPPLNILETDLAEALSLMLNVLDQIN